MHGQTKGRIMFTSLLPTIFILIVCVESVTTDKCVATRSFTYGKKYFLVFLPIHYEDGRTMKKGLDIVITLKTTSASYHPYFGLIIFDTCNNKKVLTQQLLTLYTDIELLQQAKPFECRDSASCADTYIDIVGVIAYLDPVSARLLGSFMYNENLAIIVKLNEKKQFSEPYDIKALELFKNIVLVPEIRPIIILRFLIKYNNWSNLVVIVTDSVSQKQLERALPRYCVYYLNMSPQAIHQHQNEIKFQKLFQHFNSSFSTAIDAIIVWSSAYQVAYPVIKQLDILPPVIINWDAYRIHYIRTTQHLNVYTISSIDLDSSQFKRLMVQNAATDKWVNAYLNQTGLSLVPEIFQWQQNFNDMFRNYIIHYMLRDTPLTSGDYLFSQVQRENRTKIMQLDNACNSLKCLPGYYLTWKTRYNNSYYDKSRIHKCVKCKPGFIKPDFGSTTCKPCNDLTLPNVNRTQCLPKHSIYLKWIGTTSILMTLFLFIGVLTNISFFVVYLKNGHTPIVRASNLRLSCAQLSAHFLLFLLLATFIGKPDIGKCIVISWGIGFLLTTILSITIAKSQKLLMIFRTPGKMQPREIAMTSLIENMLIAMSIMLQTILTLVSLILSEMQIKQSITSESIYCTCAQEHLSYQLSFAWVMAILCFIQAYRTRLLPSCYNDSKVIAFATSINILILSLMLLPLSSVHPTNPVEQTVSSFKAIYCMNIISLMTIYAYKVWTIIFSPHKNTKDFLYNKNLKPIQRDDSVVQLVD